MLDRRRGLGRLGEPVSRVREVWVPDLDLDRISVHQEDHRAVRQAGSGTDLVLEVHLFLRCLSLRDLDLWCQG